MIDGGSGGRDANEIVASGSDWERFRAELDAIDVWSWQASYSDNNILDGTSWFVKIEWPDRSLRTSGSNAYPPGWDTFCHAVQELAEGLPFS